MKLLWGPSAGYFICISIVISCCIFCFCWFWVVWVLVFVSLYWLTLSVLRINVNFPSASLWKGCRAFLVLQVYGVAPSWVEQPGYTGLWCYPPSIFGQWCSVTDLSLISLLVLVASLLLAVVVFGSLLFVNLLFWWEKNNVGFFPHCPSKACVQTAFGLELIVYYFASAMMP